MMFGASPTCLIHNNKQFMRVKKVFVVITAILISITSLSYLFIQLWKPFGARPSAEDMLNYAQRAQTHYRDGKFCNLADVSTWTNDVDPYEQRASHGKIKPTVDIPTDVPFFETKPEIRKLNVTWFGHSSLFIQIHGMNILYDPIFSNICSPFSLLGTYRYGKLPIDAAALPPIDICIISHDHYDHLDYKTILAIDNKVHKYIVPLGLDNHLVRFGIKREKIETMDWWETTNINGLNISCTPAQHFSGRILFDSNKTLWASWVITDEFHQIFATGDSGFGNHFNQIHDRFGDMELVMSDGAQYNKRWHTVHMYPEEAIDMAKIMGAKHYLPMHWGAFVLSDHAWNDPVLRQTQRALELNLDILLPKIGQTFSLNDNDSSLNILREQWW